MHDNAESSEEASAAPTVTRVLVAETDRHLQSVLCWTLDHDERFSVVARVSSGDQAVACCEPFDLALVALTISGLGGMGTIARLHRRTPVPVVVVLAPVDPIYLRHAAADEGAVGFLVAPRDLDNLPERLVELIETSRSHPRHHDVMTQLA
jgi:DNA-binding response OmpR family regulator